MTFPYRDLSLPGRAPIPGLPELCQPVLCGGHAALDGALAAHVCALDLKRDKRIRPRLPVSLSILTVCQSSLHFPCTSTCPLNEAVGMELLSAWMILSSMERDSRRAFSNWMKSSHCARPAGGAGEGVEDMAATVSSLGPDTL